ncbi:MAG: hypothetical protein Q7T55_05825 [Solirubrobacteraceae bacterium]|nr:hypothetical protein [Solirubrobacteraceae bacterium]
MQRLRLLLLPLIALFALGGFASTASAAKSSITIGIGDQSTKMFASSDYKALGLKKTRYFFPWNGMDDQFTQDRAREFVDEAKAQGVSVLFHLSTDDFTARKAKLPSVSAYKAQLKKIVAFFGPRGVHEWGVWNEANHVSQPTYKNPVRAADFYKAMYAAVPKGDNIVALDVLDQGGVDGYIKKFYGRLSSTYRKRAKIVGIHNYGDVNRNRSTYTSKMISATRKYNRSAKFWFTETGGLVEFKTTKTVFKCDTKRAASRTKSVFSLATKYKSQGVQRVYLYNWTGAGCGKTRFDAGLTDPDGTVRPAYNTVKALLSKYSR